MPLETPVDFGTDGLGYRVNDYCRFCYQEGGFTQPGMTLDMMIEQGVAFLAEKEHMTGANAQAMLEKILPRLKRWRQLEPVTVSEGRGFTGGDELC